MEQKLKEAIEIVENFGGFVMFPESSEEEREIRQRTFEMEREMDLKAEQKKLDDAREALEARNDFLSRKEQAFKEATDALYNRKSLSFQDIDDIFYENGIEPDYIEDWLESQI